jgi:hypothetical protein
VNKVRLGYARLCFGENRHVNRREKEFEKMFSKHLKYLKRKSEHCNLNE